MLSPGLRFIFGFVDMGNVRQFVDFDSEHLQDLGWKLCDLGLAVVPAVPSCTLRIPF